MQTDISALNSLLRVKATNFPLLIVVALECWDTRGWRDYQPHSCCVHWRLPLVWEPLKTVDKNYETRHKWTVSAIGYRNERFEYVN